MKAKAISSFYYKSEMVKIEEILSLNPIMFNKMKKMGCVEKIGKEEEEKTPIVRNTKGKTPQNKEVRTDGRRRKIVKK